MLVIKAGINKMLVRIENRENKSDLGLHSLSMPFWQATGVQNFRTFTVASIYYLIGKKKQCWLQENIVAQFVPDANTPEPVKRAINHDTSSQSAEVIQILADKTTKVIQMINFLHGRSCDVMSVCSACFCVATNKG